ncbi:hypothetical protein KM043_009261 [Ampulex compressa]|nr:hypothetical protein KM043_009261 [Ampulex compressa]
MKKQDSPKRLSSSRRISPLLRISPRAPANVVKGNNARSPEQNASVFPADKGESHSERSSASAWPRAPTRKALGCTQTFRGAMRKKKKACQRLARR